METLKVDEGWINQNTVNPRARSSDGVLYGSERVYASKDDPSEYTREGEKYTIKGEDIPKKSLHKDADMGLNHKSYYIETDKKLKVNPKNN